jgi:glycosyltransferase involved in cell wall biosynthesis
MNKNIILYLLNKIANWVDIKYSDRVIAQNNFQKLNLLEKFKVDSIIIKNHIETSSSFDKKSIGDYILWVGIIRSIKQPELLLKLAQYFPNYNFLMIGGVGESVEFFNRIKNNAEKIKNVNFKGFVSPEKIHTYYQKAILLINTSKIEGFPNIFLEAWSCSVPVVSLNIDPDGIISKYKLGYCSITFDQMLKNIEILLKDRQLLETMGKNGRKYVEENHNICKIVDQYENLILSLIEKPSKKKNKMVSNI